MGVVASVGVEGVFAYRRNWERQEGRRQSVLWRVMLKSISSHAQQFPIGALATE